MSKETRAFFSENNMEYILGWALIGGDKQTGN